MNLDHLCTHPVPFDRGLGIKIENNWEMEVRGTVSQRCGWTVGRTTSDHNNLS